MAINEKNAAPIPQGPEDEEIKRTADRAARIAAAEEVARKDRNRISEYEQLVAVLSALPPSAVNRFLNGFSAEAIVAFLRQIPDLSDQVTRWSEQYFESLMRPDIAQDLRRLEDLGIKRGTMAIAMKVIGFAPIFDNSFAQLGDTRERRQRAKRILTPVPDLLELAKVFGEVPPLLSQKFPNPSKIISELKLLSSVFDWGELIYDSLGANHLVEVAKFGLASLVHETTGKFLDREVDNLVGAALDHHRYDETAYRVWRINNYERLQQNVPIITRFFVALNTVVS